MERSVSKFVYWTPRVLSVIFIIFLMMMFLDVFSEGLNFWGTALGLFMHNIPALVLLVVLIISWRYEMVGGIIFILAGVAYAVAALINPFEWYLLAWIVQISGVAFVIGVLFLVCWFKKKKRR